MRHHRARFLHVLVLAPVAAIVAGALGPTPRALAAPAKAPAPIVVTVDPAFGGQPSAANPNMPFDPGAIGVNGVLEKDVDLDVGERLARLLRTDLVDVVMTRSTDVYASDSQRQRSSSRHHAVLVVSILANTSNNAKAAGSLVTYASAASRAFAQTLSDALGAGTTPDGVPDLGVSPDLRAWADSHVPTAAVKMAYLSNPPEAALMTTAAFRDDVAAAIRSGLEAYMPTIVARRNEIIAWRNAHPGSVSPSLNPTSANIPEGTGFRFGPLMLWLLAIAAVGLVLLFRDAVARVLVVVIAVTARLFGALMWLQRAAIRRQRRRRRERTGTRAEQPYEPRRQRAPSVYDDIPL
ncbi:MAG TPA: N-acetylmuramoyl-L-alanine amidase [Candidatus Saccharimonadales bacterium]|nr:N-acetylmuramoyl-L-alanine amidase [Candidatus Saccharimonadales bacterium]